jgi:hypothetical protein
MLEQEGSPDHWPPLGLPAGSVRALMTLIVVAVVTQGIVRSQPVDPLWTETLLIALAWYFTARRFLALPPDLLVRLQQEGHIEQEHNPLYLPRHSIRVLIVVNFCGLAWWLQQEGRLQEPAAVSLLVMVAAVVFGSLIRGIAIRLGLRKQSRWSSRWGDLRALAVLGTVVAAAGMRLLMQENHPLPEIDRVALALMLFYFGAR